MKTMTTSTKNREPQEDHRVSTESQTGTGRTLAIAAACVFVVLVIGFAIAFLIRHHQNEKAKLSSEMASKMTPEVVVVKVQSSGTTYPLVLPGQTAGWYQSPLYARVDGYVASWKSDIGDRVKQGEVLATIDTPDLDQQLNAARAKAAASEAQVTVAESNMSIAKLTYERWRDSPKGVVSEQEREEKKATYDSAMAHLAEAKAQTQLDHADVNRYSAMESFRQVVAPYDGVITARNIDIGDLVTAGSSGNTRSLYAMAQTDTIRVFVDVPQKMAAEVSSGLKASVTSNQFSGRIFSGEVARSSQSIDPQSRTQRTEVDIPNKDHTLTPGANVQVTFQLSQHGLLSVPAAAILFKPQGLQVAVVDQQNKVEFRNVQVAKDNGDTVELSSGVEPTDRVALNIRDDITPGEVVKPMEGDLK
jgi:RND family efflux transporter MFP subunit